MYKTRIDAFYDMPISEVLTRLEHCAKDMRDCSHPDQWDHAHSLAWELMNVVSRHSQSAYGIDSKFKKAPYIDPVSGKSLAETVREYRKAESEAKHNKYREQHKVPQE